MSDHIKKLQQAGYHVVQTTQQSTGTAYAKVTNKVMEAYDAGHRKIAVVTNAGNPHVTNISELVARCNRNLVGLTAIVEAK